jgi:hypothetical protein
MFHHVFEVFKGNLLLSIREGLLEYLLKVSLVHSREGLVIQHAY